MLYKGEPEVSVFKHPSHIQWLTKTKYTYSMYTQRHMYVFTSNPDVRNVKTVMQKYCRKIIYHQKKTLLQIHSLLSDCRGARQLGVLFAESHLYQYRCNKGLAWEGVSATAMNFPALISFHQYFCGNENVWTCPQIFLLSFFLQ